MTSSGVTAVNEVASGTTQSQGFDVVGGVGSKATASLRRQQTMPITHYNTFHGPFFWTTRSPRRQYFTIHPEWASENIVPASWIALAAARQRQLQAAVASGTWTPPRTGRRCHSAPPGTRSRNPITWENW